jgi:hypothetical protein
MLYQRIDRYTDLSYESYNIYIHHTLYIIYRRRGEHPEGRKDIRRILRRWARKSRSQRAAKNVWLLLASWRASAAPQPFRRSAPRLSPISPRLVVLRRKRQSDDEFTPHCLRWSLLVVVAARMHQRVDEHHETKLELNHHDISLYSTKLN